MIDDLEPFDGKIKTTETKPAAYVLHDTESGAYYVGSSVKPGLRISRHFTLLKGNRHDNKNLQEIYDKNPNLQPSVFLARDKEEATRIEQKLVDHFVKEGKCINIGIVDVNAPNKGRVTPDDVRAKQSIAAQGRVVPEEVRLKAIAVNTGRPKTDEHRAKLSEAKKGKPQPDSVKELLMQRIEARKVKVNIDGNSYDSIKDAARQLAVNERTVGRRLESDDSKWIGWKKE